MHVFTVSSLAYGLFVYFIKETHFETVLTVLLVMDEMGFVPVPIIGQVLRNDAIRLVDATIRCRNNI